MTVVPLFLLTLGAINWGYIYPLVFLFVSILRPRLEGRPIYLNFLYSPGFWILLCTGMSYVAIGLRSVSAVYHHGILPLIAYAIGWTIAESQSDEEIRDGILSLVAGFGVYASLNSVVNIGNSRYTLIDFWTGSYRAATGSGILNTMTVSLSVYTIALEKRKNTKYFFYILLAFTILYMFMLGTRTQFIILFVVSIFGIMLLSYRKYGLTGTLKFIVIAGIVLCAAVLIYNQNLFSIRDMILNTNLADRFTNQESLDASDAFRFQSFWEGLKDIFLYPLGGRISQTYRHNMWLDVGRVSGLFPFLMLIIYSANNIVKVSSIYRDRNVLPALRYLIVFLYAGIYLNFFVEPIWEGEWNFFLSTCVIDGMVGAMKRRPRNESGTGESLSFA